MEFLENTDPKQFIFTEKYQTKTEEVVVYCAQCINIYKFVQKENGLAKTFYNWQGLMKMEINGILSE